MMECVESFSPTGFHLSVNLAMSGGALWKCPFMNFQPSELGNAGTTIWLRTLKRTVQLCLWVILQSSFPPALMLIHAARIWFQVQSHILAFRKWLMMFGGTQTPVSRVEVRCDPPLNLDLHPSWHFPASGSILQHIVCSSHLKQRRWL